MSAAEVAIPETVEEAAPQAKTGRSKKTRTDTKPKRQPPYAVVLHNDEINSMEFVVGVLRKVFNYGRIKSFRLMMQTHVSGRCIIWSGTLELAELKAEQVKSCGPDPLMMWRGATTLGVTVEALPQ